MGKGSAGIAWFIEYRPTRSDLSALRGFRGQMTLLSFSIRPVVAVENRRR
jgi:hypothetical protein